MTTALMERPKPVLAKMVGNLEAARGRERRAAEKMGEKLMDTLGTGTAFATAALVGLAEGRISNKDGSPLSLGPVPLTLAVATGLTGLSWFWNPNQQVSYASAGCAGAYGVTLARVWGRTWKAKAGGVSGVGYAGLTPEEQALAYGEE